MQPDERLQIYLTNTLEPIEPQANWLLPALSKEVESAQEVKNKKILVITGNPPYSGISLNRGEWISKLIDTYKWVDSKPFGEKKHWLNDDYVKFIRFAQWKMEQVDEGIVGIITNHSFLDNPTFRGMRQSLMQTFNRMYFLDLHGSTKRKETTPEDGKDENVFDIEQGVCISLFVRKQGLERKISHDDLWGKRKEKYRACMEYEIANMAWKNLSPKSPFYFFKPRDESGIDVYNSYFPITEIFQTYSIGVQTSRDSLAVAIQRGELEQRIKEFIDQSKSTEEIIKKFKLKNTRGWTPQYSRDIISKIDNWKSFITPYEYRPFDCRYVYYHPQMVDWPRFAIMNNFIKDNIALLAPRQLATDYYRHAFVSDKICDMCLISTLTKEQNRVFPLYQYNLYDDKKHKTRQFEETDPFSGKERIENFTPEFRRRIDNKYDHCYGSEEIFGYIYAILNNITYRRKYIEFLKIDFPKIPLVDNPETFERLSALGWQLVQAHLLLDIPESLKVDLTRGNDAVEKPVYVATQQRLYINDEQYFSPVPDDVWSFHIGCYQVMDKYLRYRKGRELSLDEKENIMNVVKVLRFTIDLMQEIDEIWKP